MKILGQEFNTICQENEAWTYYGTACPDTCKNWALKIRRCTLEFKQGCFCVNGTVRDEKTNKCVKKEDCPERKSKHSNILLSKPTFLFL